MTPSHILSDQLTLSQPGGIFCCPPPGFSGLPTALSDDSTSIKLVTQHFFFSKINYRVEDCAAIFVLYSTLKSISKNIKSFQKVNNVSTIYPGHRDLLDGFLIVMNKKLYPLYVLHCIKVIFRKHYVTLKSMTWYNEHVPTFKPKYPSFLLVDHESQYKMC